MFKELRRTYDAFRRQHPPHRPDAPVVRVSNLSVQYGSGPALSNVGFELPAGQRIGVIGPNGAGKSTLFKVLAGMITPTSGRVEMYGSAPNGHICIGYVPQRSQVDWNFPVTVRDVVLMGRTGKLGLFRRAGRHDHALVDAALELVKLAPLAHRQISQLSGGQQQRMFIARALAQEAELLLMDEPLTGLDAQSRDTIFAILDELRERKVTVLFALHDLQLAARFFDQVMLLNRRLVGFGPTDTVLTAQNLLSAYGSHLHMASNGNDTVLLADSCCGEGADPHA
jgi:ABC-type Mn2+/Zn2+ transport system ATPase subunit